MTRRNEESARDVEPEAPKKPRGNSGKPISLAPLTPKEAMADLLKVKPEERKGATKHGKG